MVTIRAADSDDRYLIWTILEPIIRAGDAYALPRDLDEEASLAYWFAQGNEVFVAKADGIILGTYYLRANQRGGGSHVANCGYATSVAARGRGVAAAMCMHSLDRARSRGFRAMQFNFVLSTNQIALHLWRRHGFEIVGTLPEVFLHPALGYVDAFVMYREL